MLAAFFCHSNAHCAASRGTSDVYNGRPAEGAAKREADLIVNVQGDEPDIEPELIDALVRELDEAEMATLATEFGDQDATTRSDTRLDHGTVNGPWREGAVGAGENIGGP